MACTPRYEHQRASKKHRERRKINFETDSGFTQIPQHFYLVHYTQMIDRMNTWRSWSRLGLIFLPALELVGNDTLGTGGLGMGGWMAGKWDIHGWLGEGEGKRGK